MGSYLQRSTAHVYIRRIDYISLYKNILTYIQVHKARHFGSYQQSKLSVPQRKGRYSAVKSSQLSGAGQYKKFAQYDFQFTSEYSALHYKLRSNTFY